MARLNIDYFIKNRIALAVVGSTASGKTDLGLKLAELFDSEIISADSRQIYKYLDIGTAKPSKDELNQAKHHFIDHISPDEYFSAGDFAEQGKIIVNNLFMENKVPLIVGGTGLYISALCEGFFKEPENADYSDIRIELEKRLEENGKDALYDELNKIDLNLSEIYDDKNPRRLIRALEYYYAHGETLSSAREKFTICPDFKTLYLYLNWDRNKLYDRINRRSEIMWQSGLVEETKKILEMGYDRNLNSLNTIGYKEALLYLDGDFTEQRAIETLKQKTRNYAKRQVTWFKKIPNFINIDPTNYDIEKTLSSYEIPNIT